MPKNEAETRYELIDPVLRAKGYRLPYIRLETPAPVEPIGPKTDAKPAAIEPLEAQIKEREKAARDSQSKADAIGATVFDLKAVNPNAVVKLDTRTPVEVIQSIQHQAAIVAQSLQTLQKLLANEHSSATE
jgi:hypothetical protein